MEWVETTGRTIEEARELALDQLGVDSSEAEFETLEEPRSGLFGRTRGAARVRARVAPRVPRPKVERKRRGRRDDSGGASPTASESGTGNERQGSSQRDDAAGAGDADSTTEAPAAPAAGEDRSTGARGGRQQGRDRAPQRENRTPMDTQEQMDVLEQFLVELAAGFGVSARAVSRMEDNVLTVDLQGDDLGLLVGPRLATLDAVQEVARHALQRQAAGREYAKVVVDVAGIRQRRNEALGEFVSSAAQRVLDEDAEVVFEVMSSVDRKQVHDLVASLDGVVSSSEGEDPRRRVVIRRP